MSILKWIQDHADEKPSKFRVERDNQEGETVEVKWLNMHESEFNRLMDILFQPPTLPVPFRFNGRWYNLDACDEPE